MQDPRLVVSGPYLRHQGPIFKSKIKMYVADEVGRVRGNNWQTKSEWAGQKGREQMLLEAIFFLSHIPYLFLCLDK